MFKKKGPLSSSCWHDTTLQQRVGPKTIGGENRCFLGKTGRSLLFWNPSLRRCQHKSMRKPFTIQLSSYLAEPAKTTSYDNWRLSIRFYFGKCVLIAIHGNSLDIMDLIETLSTEGCKRYYCKTTVWKLENLDYYLWISFPDLIACQRYGTITSIASIQYM